ncbi:hypothetical protein GCM10011506_40470 [Marivirga lumbricoides]|uniref:Uncharacterized protein n=1 Tax=Marivirga lumbricoides TaxID=1046115 RepID=A0ABQ1N5D6_9BACT|nr:hypothetical protein GCM10011506_40470 [Marivirga lumbricoides]
MNGGQYLFAFPALLFLPKDCQQNVIDYPVFEWKLAHEEAESTKILQAPAEDALKARIENKGTYLIETFSTIYRSKLFFFKHRNIFLDTPKNLTNY